MIILLFQRNLIDRFTLLGVDQVGVDLGGGYVFVGQHLRDRIDVRARCDLQRGVGVAEAVEGDVLLDACRRNPLFQRIVYHTARQSFEHRAAGLLAAQVDGLLTHGQYCLGLRLLRADSDAVAHIGCNLEVFPFQFEHIADAQSRQTREERCPFQHIYRAGRCRQSLQLVGCQIVLLHIFGLDFVEEVIDILPNQFIAVGGFKQPAEGREVTRRRIAGDFPVGQPQLMGVEQIVAETFAEFDGDVAEGTVPAREVGEVAVNRVPFFILSGAHLAEVGEKVAAHLVVVEKVELLIDKRRYAQTANRLGLFKHRAVEVTFGLVGRAGIDINAQILEPRHLHRFGIADGGIEIEIERQTPSGNFSSQQGDACAGVMHNV